MTLLDCKLEPPFQNWGRDVVVLLHRIIFFHSALEENFMNILHVQLTVCFVNILFSRLFRERCVSFSILGLRLSTPYYDVIPRVMSAYP